MAIDPRAFVDFIDKVVKFRIVHQRFINGHGEHYREEYCVMAEVCGMRCFSEPTDTLEELKRGIAMNEGMLQFLFKNAMQPLNEEDIQQLALAREDHPLLKERTHLRVIRDRIDEMVAMEIENYPDQDVTRDVVAARLCWEEEEEPEYRRENI